MGISTERSPRPLVRCCAATMLVSGLLAGCASQSGAPQVVSSDDDFTHAQRFRVEIVDTHPFPAGTFTQGLEVDADGSLLISTGQYGSSSVFRLHPGGEITELNHLDPEFFGEGLTRSGENVWQLTWQEEVAFRRDHATLEEIGRVPYPGEGWGLCAFDDELIMSDGSDQLRLLDPGNFGERGRVAVTMDGEPVTGINELECVDGVVFANIFTTTDIVEINASTGVVTKLIDASNLPNNGPADDPNAVLNGIAHIPGTDRFYLAGKLWPDLYEVRFVADN